jgi:hypothetical protein
MRTRSRGWAAVLVVLALVVCAGISGRVAGGRAEAAAAVAQHQALVFSAQSSLDRAIVRLGEVPAGRQGKGDLPGAPSLEQPSLAGDDGPPSVQTTLVESTADVIVGYAIVRSNGYTSTVVEKHTTSSSPLGVTSSICSYGDMGGTANDCADLLPTGITPLG